MTERQRIILGIIAVFALFVAGVLSFVLIQNGTIRADVNPATAGISFTNSLATSPDDVTVGVDTTSRACLVRKTTSRWTIVAQNDSAEAVDETVIIKAQGFGDLKLADYEPIWQTQGSYEEATINIGRMNSGQIVTFELTGAPSASNATVAAALSDSTGFIYSTSAGLTVPVKNACD